MSVKEVTGNLIDLAVMGEFDVIGHCTNCFNTQGGGIAVPMSKTFGTDKFYMEGSEFEGDINKLGTIDYEEFVLGEDNKPYRIDSLNFSEEQIANMSNPRLTVVNSYGQFGLGGRFGNSPYGIPFDYDAFRMCLRKINHIFKGKKIGLPKFIGCGLAGGDWTVVEQMIADELKDCDVTIVYLEPKPFTRFK